MILVNSIHRSVKEAIKKTNFQSQFNTIQNKSNFYIEKLQAINAEIFLHL